MKILVALIAACAFVALLKKPLRAHPGIFYASAAALDVLLLAGNLSGVPVPLWASILSFHARGLFGFALFAIVMFVGVLGDGSRLKTSLLPIRAELSILASILIAGHIANYLEIYCTRLLSLNIGTLSAGASLVVACAATALLVPLAITSVKAVKKRMSARSWKRLQRFAYLFWGLAYAHLALILLQPARSNGAEALTSLAIYSIIFAVYTAARIRRWRIDTRQKH